MMNLSRWKVSLVVLATLFGVLFTTPNLMSAEGRAKLPGFLPSKAMNLGLDLQGGSSLLYSVDTQALRNERLNNLTEDVRKTLTEAQIPFTDLGQVNGALSVLDFRCQAGPHTPERVEQHDCTSVSYVRRGSFGYRARGYRRVPEGRVLEEIDLLEVSLVSHPLQPGARVHLVQ